LYLLWWNKPKDVMTSTPIPLLSITSPSLPTNLADAPPHTELADKGSGDIPSEVLGPPSVPGKLAPLISTTMLRRATHECMASDSYLSSCRAQAWKAKFDRHL